MELQQQHLLHLQSLQSLRIDGLALPLDGKYAVRPQLTMRRIYNTKCFRDERYRHEIANHYRDFKMQQPQRSGLSTQPQPRRWLQRRRRRRSTRRTQAAATAVAMATAMGQGSASSLMSQYAQQFRCVLPTHVHYFPRFSITYAPRGRQTICGKEPPDETYNDAVRRIRSAQSFEQLKALVQRHLARTGAGKHNSYTETATRGETARRATSAAIRGQSSHKYARHQTTSQQGGNSYSNEVAHQTTGQQATNSSNKYSEAGGVEGGPQCRPLLESIKINKAVAGRVESPQRERIDFYTFLQLASAYYERGLHANIKYLQSIAVPPNAISSKNSKPKPRPKQHRQQRQQGQLQSQRQQQIEQKASASSSPAEEEEEEVAEEVQVEEEEVEEHIEQQKPEGEGEEEEEEEEEHQTLSVQWQRSGERTLVRSPSEELYLSVHIRAPKRVKNNINNNSNYESNNNNSMCHLDRVTGRGNLNATTIQDQRNKVYEIIDNLSQLTVDESSDECIVNKSTQLPFTANIFWH